jgi:ribosomal protein S12 methylthiotransferase accessory factor
VVAFDELTKVGWVPARELGSSTTCWVPASKVFFPYDRALLGEVAVLQPFTTGLAAHALPSAAILGAICEVVERDAFSIVWQAKMSVPEIRLESLDDPNRALVERHVRSGRELRLFDMTLDHGIPSVLAVLRSASGAEPALVFAAATAPSPRVAVQKCLEEMQLMRVFADFLDTSRPRVRREAREVQTREDHVRFYCDHENTRLVEFLLGATEIRELDELPSLATGDTDRDLALVVERLRGMGHPVLVREFSAPELAELGLTVVRAIVAGFQPLAFGHAARALALPRLWTVPKRLGYPGIEPETGDNPAPHPFP